MERYPQIPHRTQVKTKGEIFYAFDKLDGSNVRVEWTKKNGYHKFGRRKALLDNSNEFLPESEDIIRAKYASELEEVFKSRRWPLVTCFFEFFGPNSFAGNHVHEPHDAVLLDVRPFKKGIIPPREFLKHFDHLDIPKLLYKGPMNQELIESVENGTLEGMTFEGVVCKGSYDRKKGRPTMFKIKNRAWLEKLRARCPDEKTFERLR